MLAELHRPAVGLAALFAAAAPSLLAYNTAPSPTFLNQALALAAWGWFVSAIGDRGRPLQGTGALVGALVLMALGVAWSFAATALPATLALSAAGLCGAALILVGCGAIARSGPLARPAFAWFCIAWVVAGLINTGIAMIQVLAPAWPDGDWIARSSLSGRAVGNLRQPNHLSSLLLWAAIALVPLLEAGRLRLRSAAAMMALFMLAVVLTASRTGLVSVLLLAAWGLLDRRPMRSTRLLLVSAPLWYALAWAGMWAWAHAGAHAFGGEARLAASDVSSSRFGIWANAIELIRLQPWSGVGWGNFNLAWSLTPFPGRPTAFFDHAHSLPLQLLVELGLPLGGAVLALLGLALWQAWRRSAGEVPVRAAFMLVLMIGVHSLLEYPLWYAYFLLPAAWAWGYALGRPGPAGPDSPASAGRLWPWASVALVLAAGLAVLDYQRVARIFEPGGGDAPLAQRIEQGRHSVLFGHHADYAAATGALAAPGDVRIFDRPAHYLLDTRLMAAWARALAAAGQDDAARSLAARLREFGPHRAPELFAACATAASAADAFACQPPARELRWRDFVAR